MSTNGLSVKRLESGYYLIRGNGPCNFTQPPEWPCSEFVIRDHAHPEASEEFIRECVAEVEALYTGKRGW